MKILLFDNYDSFTYNLYHCLKRHTNASIDVIRNDKISVAEVGGYDKILLSPGPGLPEESGILLPLIREYAATKSILGVCLGEQAIGENFGARLINLPGVFHGVATTIFQQKRKKMNNDILRGLPDSFEAGRYHSWAVSRDGFPDELEITAEDAHGEIMALRHRKYDVQGVQFHPESVLTPLGDEIIKNWLNR
ncbi:MAG: aminodeoxychorismate/anthranilate synthase component II [Chitinophagaceae bacterium]|nr:aminodeoxychorismate/anthranilate synthase component II [Chitinophagaceae bacterium]MCZ2395973.1 aminodeoxychorismate/anthranilate synthase component II [Chitinophagales bacterium]